MNCFRTAGICGKQTEDTASRQPLFFDDEVEHTFGIVEQATCGIADGIVIENIGIGSDQFPRPEERSSLCDHAILPADSLRARAVQASRDRRRPVFPVDIEPVLARICQADGTGG